MKLILKGHDYRYACEQMLLTLFPEEKPIYEGEADSRVILKLSRGESYLTATARLYRGEQVWSTSARARVTELTGEKLNDDRVCQRILKLAFFRAGCEALGGRPAWGALTGVRPVKLPTKALLAGKSEKEAARVLSDTYYVTADRVELAMDCAKASISLLRELNKEDISLYIGIPFCPTRCAYCSFVSADVSKSLKMLDPFLDCLEKELIAVGENLARSGRRIRTVYMGGGTPTTLSAQQMDRLLSAMEKHLDLSACMEFTVEAGRPDTITREKMEVLASHRVNRVSVNPQTMRDHVLEAMGRAHRSEDILRAYADVRAAGRFDVNMDLIAGLPRDDEAGFRETLEQVIALRPENITVHTLALKKGAALMMERQGLPAAGAVAAMLDYAWRRLREEGYLPYYLYRQKYMSGGFENVGWCLPGTVNKYNIIMMEELHSVLSLGGGGMTKLVDREKGSIRRINNPKFPKEYMERITLLCQEKQGMEWTADEDC